jgi:putative methyltransferase (TIGR04325 family)
MATTIKETFFRCKNYEEAQDKTCGYENINLIEELVESNKNKPPWSNNNNLYVDHRQLELSAAFMYIICESRYTDISVSDVGGGNGYLSVSVKKLLTMINWEWTVFESNKIALAYSQFEKESGIKWKSSNTHIIRYSEVALFSCTLQYLESPFEVLKKYALKHKYLIITRVPFINENNCVITRQTFPDGGDYQSKSTSWPAWFFSRENFYTEINKIGNIVYQWKTPTEVLLFEGDNVIMEGMIIRVV